MALQSSQTGGGWLLKGLDAEAQTGHNSSAFRDGESPGYFFIVTSQVSANLYVTKSLHL